MSTTTANKTQSLNAVLQLMDIPGSKRHKNAYWDSNYSITPGHEEGIFVQSERFQSAVLGCDALKENTIKNDKYLYRIHWIVRGLQIMPYNDRLKNLCLSDQSED